MNHTKEADRVLPLLKDGKQELDNKLFLAMHEVLHMDLHIQQLEAEVDNYRSEETRLLARIQELEGQLREARDKSQVASLFSADLHPISTPPMTTGLYCTECYREVLERDFDFTHGMCMGCYVKEK